MSEMLFEDVGGLPIPRLPGIDGAPVKGDAVQFFELAQAVGHFGCTEAALRELHTTAWPPSRGAGLFAAPVAPAMAADPKAMAALESCARTWDMEFKRLRYPDLPQEFFDEFMEVCRLRKLDPRCNQIYAGTRHNPRTNLPELAIIVGIEGLRLIALRTGMHAGCDKTQHTYDADGNIVESSTTVYRGTGMHDRVPFEASVFWQDYYPGEGVDVLWDDMPHMNMARVSEAAALRRAHPQEMGRFYSPEEMARARARRRPTGPQPAHRGRSVAMAGADANGYYFDPSTSQE